MKFEDQVKEAKVKKLQYRILRDITFIILGAIFLIISIVVEIKKEDNKKNNNKKSTNTTVQTKTYLE